MAKVRTAKPKRNMKTVSQLLDSRQPGNQKLARRGSGPLQLPPSGRSAQDSRTNILATVHPDSLADVAYLHLSNKMALGQEQLEMAVPAVLSFQRQMRPKDALERLALTQALMAHGRVAWLTKLATSQTNVHALATINESCERASGTFVRLMRAIGEYRQPRDSSATVSIGQANLAHQQIVQNIQKQEARQEGNVDERTRIRANKAAASAEAISAVQERVAITPNRHLANPAVDEEHRPQEPGRKGSHQHERAQTWRKVRRHRQAAKTNESDT